MNKGNFQLPEIDADALELFGAPNKTGSPERNMLMAILERAILDFVGNDPQQIELAKDWIFDDCQYPYKRWSFPWLCEQLDLEPERIAAAVKAMPKRGKRKIAPWYFMKHNN